MAHNLPKQKLCMISKRILAAKFCQKAASLCELMVCDFKDGTFFDSWTCISDGVIGGKSTVELKRSENGHAMCCGYLSTELPPDKVTKHSGFCTIRTKPKKVSM